MKFTKKEITELLRILWRGIGTLPKPRSKENGIWKKIEKKLTKELKKGGEKK